MIVDPLSLVWGSMFEDGGGDVDQQIEEGALSVWGIHGQEQVCVCWRTGDSVGGAYGGEGKQIRNIVFGVSAFKLYVHFMQVPFNAHRNPVPQHMHYLDEESKA